MTGTSHFQMYPGALDRQPPGLRALSHSSEKCLKVCAGENIRRTCECREKFVCFLAILAISVFESWNNYDHSSSDRRLKCVYADLFLMCDCTVMSAPACSSSCTF